MEDKTTIGNNENAKTPSEAFSEYIESLVEEVVLNNVVFNDHKKYLQRYSQEEGIDYASLERNLTEFFETVEELKSNESKAGVRLAKMLAKDCYLEEDKVNDLLVAMNKAREKETERVAAEMKAEEERIAAEKKAKEERLAREKAERKAKEERERRAKEDAEQKAMEEARKAKEETERKAAEERRRKEMNAPKIVKTFNVNGVSFNMVFVKGGTFMMGATPEQGWDAMKNEKPAHEVSLSDFLIGETMVTLTLWNALMDLGSDSLYPVHNSYLGVWQFIRRLNKFTGYNFGLPSEAEWEYAARGGCKSQGYKYAGSNNIDEVAVYEKNNHSTFYNPDPVMTKKPNELGLYDMSGNLSEWCSDWYDEDYYKNSPVLNPKGPETGTERVVRGGSYSSSDWSCRVSSRCPTEDSSAIYGFRLRLDPFEKEIDKMEAELSIANVEKTIEHVSIRCKIVLKNCATKNIRVKVVPSRVETWYEDHGKGWKEKTEYLLSFYKYWENKWPEEKNKNDVILNPTESIQQFDHEFVFSGYSLYEQDRNGEEMQYVSFYFWKENPDDGLDDMPKSAFAKWEMLIKVRRSGLLATKYDFDVSDCHRVK